MSPSSRRRVMQSKEWERYCMDFYAVPSRTPCTMSKVSSQSAELCWADHMRDEAAFHKHHSVHVEEYDSSLPQRCWKASEDEHKGWESASCEVISQSSLSSQSQEGKGSYSRARQVYKSPLMSRSKWNRSGRGGRSFLKQNMALPQAILEREGSFKQSLSMFSPSLLTPDDAYIQEERLVGRHSLSTPGAKHFREKRMYQNMNKRTMKASIAACAANSAPQIWKTGLSPTEQVLILKAHELNSATDSMSDETYFTSSGQLKPCLHRMRKKSIQCQLRYQAPDGPYCTDHSHLSGYQGEGDKPSNTTADAHHYDRFFQTESTDQSKVRHCEELSSTIGAAECLQLALPKNDDLAVCEVRPRSLSQKYRPKVFEEIVGQQIVSQSLSSAVAKGKIAPVYLFQGPRGTGKTSAARIFAAALLCAAPQEQRPCGLCTECSLTWLGKNAHVKEVDAASHNGIDKVKVLLEEINLASEWTLYTVFIIDECHVLTTETWSSLLKILEEPPSNVVLILITTDPDLMPHTAVSRCQKFPFLKFKDADIINRLVKIASLESIELGFEVLRIIASRADGSLRDAEMILDQLGLLGQEISSSTVNELIGSASEGKMLSLLDSALQADTVNTINKARELVDSGVPPLSLVSQMAALIIDILAGSYNFTEEQRKGFFHSQTFSESKLKRLCKSVKILSEGEKQLRHSNDRITWLTATLLQLGPDRLCMLPTSAAGTSVAQSPITMIDTELAVTGQKSVSASQSFSQGDFEFYSSSRHSDTSTRRVPFTDDPEKSDSLVRPPVQSSVEEGPVKDWDLAALNSNSPDLKLNDTLRQHELSAIKLTKIWSEVVQSCRPFRLQQSLSGHGKLVSISMQNGSEASATVHLEFLHAEHKARCERFWRNISDVFEAVLGCPVDVKTSLNSEHGWEQEVPTSPEQTDPHKTPGKEILCTIRSDGSQCNTLTPQDREHRLTSSQAASGSSLKELLEDCNWRKSNTSVSCLATMGNSMDASVLLLEEQLDKAWICDDTEEFSSSAAVVKVCDSEMPLQNPKAALSDIPTSRSHCFEVHGWSREEVKEVVELHRTSPKFHRHILWDVPIEETQSFLDGVEGCGRADARDLKDNPKDVKHGLGLRNRNRSLPGDYQNSLAESKSADFLSQELHRSSRSSKDTTLLDDIALRSSMSGGTRALAAPQLRNKLKVAAGTIARFFQGKLARNTQDAFQCI